MILHRTVKMAGAKSEPRPRHTACRTGDPGHVLDQTGNARQTQEYDHGDDCQNDSYNLFSLITFHQKPCSIIAQANAACTKVENIRSAM